MKRKRLYITLGVILAVLSIYYIFEWSSYFSTGAIRKYVFSNFSKLQAFTLRVGNSGPDGDKLGKQYFVSGVTESKSGGGSLSFFYLKKDKYGKWYVSSCGSGP
jgi:hypothetical protein